MDVGTGWEILGSHLFSNSSLVFIPQTPLSILVLMTFILAMLYCIHKFVRRQTRKEIGEKNTSYAIAVGKKDALGVLVLIMF